MNQFTHGEGRLPRVEAPEAAMWGSLGWLRFGLAVIVAATHLRSFYAEYVTTWDPARILGSFNGVAAVLGFLLVSGFSICHSLVQRPDGYVRRRFMRIYPLYLAAIVLSVWVGSYSTPTGGGADGMSPREFEDSSVFQVVANALLLQGALARPLFNNGPLWTLSLEWWLYMVAPLMLLLKRKHLVCLLIVLAVGNLSWLVVGASLGYYTRTLAFANLWFLGVFWVIGFWFYLNRGKKLIAPLVLILGVWFLTGLNRESLSGNYQTTLAFSCLILVIGGKIKWPGVLDWLGRFLGNISYPLYLIHLPMFAILNRYEIFHRAWLMLVLGIAAAIFMHVVIEKPLRLMFEKIWKKPRRIDRQSEAREEPESPEKRFF